MKKSSAILKIDAELERAERCREVWNFHKMRISLFADKNSEFKIQESVDQARINSIGPLYCCGSADIISLFGLNC